MKILLLGDYSAVNKYLKEGLVALGCDVTLASNGDWWKNIPGADMYLYDDNNTTLYKKIINKIINPIFDNRFAGYDIVQAINPMLFDWRCGTIPFRKILNNNNKFYVNGAGLDSFLYRAWKLNKFSPPYYSINDKTKNIIKGFDNKSIRSKMLNRICDYVISNAKGIIPCIPYEYEIPYEGMKNLLKPILFPVNVDNIHYEDNIPKDKIIFYHGVTRRYEKGSDFIEEAMKVIQNKYPRDVECIVSERMSYCDYIKIINKANVIIDQCCSYGYGMNACISLAKGKIVLSGAESEVLSRMGSAGVECPVFNIVPNVKQICEQMEKIIDNKNNIKIIGERSRLYVEKYHNYVNIAQEYLDVWSKN